MRLRIDHTTTYRYEPPAGGVIQILRMTPRSFESQYVVDWQIFVSTDSRLQMHHDAFGNVTHLLSHGPLADLTIHVEGVVETSDSSGVLRGTEERFPPSLYLRTTPLTEADAPMRTLAGELRAEAGDDVLGFLHALMLRIAAHMSHDADRGWSDVDAATAFALRRGACQDYAHIFIACARNAGVPARFVSGHLLRRDAGAAGQGGHAWAEAHVPKLGWVGFDPVSAMSTTDAHVRVAVALDHLGAAPVRGTRFGGGAESLDVAVKVQQAGRQNQS